MTNTNGLPPQAFTRETLSKAYDWLGTQPDSVKALAKDANTLVSLYTTHLLRAQDGFASNVDPEEAKNILKNTAPVSGEHFKSELKNLAQGLEEFSIEPAKPSLEPIRASEMALRSPSASQPTNPYPQGAGHENLNLNTKPMNQNLSGEPLPPPPTAQAQTQTLPPHVQQRHRWDPTPASGINSAVQSSNRAQGTSGLAALLDTSSQMKVARVKDSLNLSNDNEALRMLISLGFDRLKDVLPVD